jgi:predicted hotdog family 3-hydroxylacyl-ACP dehydratase
MLMDRARIAALIPHGESMCMLDEVVAWDDAHIHCRSHHFASSTNPLFEKNQLDTVLLIEYGAQAAALHAALMQSQLGETRPAYIGSVKDVELFMAIADNSATLDLHAHCLLSSSQGAIYELVAQQTDRTLLRGRLILSQPD